MPLDRAIEWKPLRDPHYVLASLRQQSFQRIFVEQAVLIRVQDAARTRLNDHLLGLLLGKRHDCPATGLTYVLVRSVLEHTTPATDESAIAARLGELLTRAGSVDSHEVLGWFCSNGLREDRLPNALAAIHTASFPHATETALMIGEGATSGAFFLHDVMAAQWYRAPFYEVIDPKRSRESSKPTCIAWADYITTDSVGPLAYDPQHVTSAAPALPDVKPARRQSLWRSLVTSVEKRQSTTKLTPISPTDSTPHAPARRPPRSATGTDHVERPDRERRDGAMHSAAGGTHSRTPASAANTASAPNAASLDEWTDTSAADTPAEYFEIARLEGFFLAATFRPEGLSTDETLWVLTEPFSGLLLTVVVEGSRVLDATLHYNLHVDDAAVLKPAFPEHIDLASGTIYATELCIDELRARCRRLRQTEALQREWRVGPAISLITPTEWEVAATDGIRGYGTTSGLAMLNIQRIGLLPEPIRRQFRLTAFEDPAVSDERIAE